MLQVVCRQCFTLHCLPLGLAVQLSHFFRITAEVHRTFSACLQADLDAKTAWIPTGIKPPAWLPRQK